MNTSHAALAFERFDGITHALSGAIGDLKSLPGLQRLAGEMPDVRERLAYVGQLTENAAHRVLGLVEEAKPACDEVAAEGRRIAQAIESKLEGGPLDEAQARRLLIACRSHAQRTAGFAEQQSALLGSLALSQDFQDLSGQVIKKVLDVILRTERQLAALLEESGAPASPARPEANELDGPQLPDKAMGQGEVDDLLASLGF